MASYANNPPTARHGQHHIQHPVPIQAPAIPAGTFAPGTKIQVGEHRVIITKYLSEGGFAHVYLVKLPRPIDGTDEAVLKRVAVPDKDTLRGMRTEVETMKRLKGHRPIVTYIDSHASERKGGGYEVFLLMEHCNGGGLIDFMNTRLQHRLTEPEILNIFSDIAEGVACMHYLKPPLLHRDIKVENVLITMHGSKRKFKLCDFGSSAPPKPAPTSVVECRLLDEDVQRHTTMQYRSPEMVDVYRKLPIDEKSDIWALGVLLYKLCYYTTPFEDQGQLAILNASYRFPGYPVFSERLKQLIASMLREAPKSRPNIYQVLRESCLMQGREVPIQDIYSARAASNPRTGERQPPVTYTSPDVPAVGAVYSPPPRQEAQTLPDITPMRRGRPVVASQAAPAPAQAATKVAVGDPFAALDSKEGVGGNDELSSRFPTLDQFSLLHDNGAKFDFDSPASPQAANGFPAPLNQRVTEHLTEEAFAKPETKSHTVLEVRRQAADPSRAKPVTATIDQSRQMSSPQKTSSLPPKPAGEKSRASAIISSNPELQAISSPSPHLGQDQPPNKPSMVSTGTMTSPPLELQTREYPPIHRFPPADQHRPTSLPRQEDAVGLNQIRVDSGQYPRPSPSPRIPAMQTQTDATGHPSSSRPSLESGRPTLEYLEPLAKTSSSAGRSRPSSMYLESSIDYLREREAAPRPSRTPSYHTSPKLLATTASPGLEPQDEPVVESNVEFLRLMEDSEKKKDKSTKHHIKRSSLGSLSGTKNILAGKFGDAFKRFEGNPSAPPARTPSPLKDMDHAGLTPIAGSEATDGRSDDGRTLDDSEMTPEMRRELEAQSLAEEERRVEAAAAEYRQKLAARGDANAIPLPRSIGGVSRAVSIQNRVQNLLDESQKSSQQVQRTASGYGKFSDDVVERSRVEKDLPEIPRKPIGTGPPPKPLSSSSESLARARLGSPAPQLLNNRSLPARPSPAPKPTHLNNIPTGSLPRSPPKQQLPPQTAPQRYSEQAVEERPKLDMSLQEKEDYMQDFSQRFPSLSSIEMVERDLGAEMDSKNKR
ncbi:kinase-like protein [Xylariaceae sp. FL1019]|nr:kinase-like protein [Xylariaceae sp. FL1019]